MVALVWNAAGQRFFEAGVDKAVWYPSNGLGGVAWNGVVAVDEKNSGGERDSFYFDGVKYLDFVANEDFSATLQAFAAPVEFYANDGMKALAAGLYATQQPRSTFGFCYRTKLGNDINQDLGYKLHLVYNCTAGPSTRSNQTQSESPSPMMKSWDLETVPPPASTYKPTAHFVIDSTKTDPAKLLTLENQLYGTGLVGGTTPKLPDQATVIGYLT